MGRIISTIVYCRLEKGTRFSAQFQEKSPGKWYGIRAEELPKLSWMEQKSLKAKVTKKGGLFSSLLGSFAPKSENTITESGSFYWDLKCPYCGCTTYVECGVCHQLTCYDDNGTFTCAICGNRGEVDGTIDGITGSDC